MKRASTILPTSAPAAPRSGARGWPGPGFIYNNHISTQFLSLLDILLDICYILTMLKKIKDTLDEKREKKNWGKGTIVVESMAKFDKIFDQFKGKMISPGGAADRLGTSRAYVHQLEKEGKIRAYRIRHDDIEWNDLPLWAKVMVAKKDVYIYIPDEDIEKIKKEMIKKAEARIKKLKGK